jgi:hypothetical protein
MAAALKLGSRADVLRKQGQEWYAQITAFPSVLPCHAWFTPIMLSFFFLPSFLIVTQLAVVLVSLLRVGRGYYRQPTHRLSVFMLLATTILLIDKAPCNSRSYY